MNIIPTEEKRHTILVVEDDHELQDMYSRRFIHDGYTVLQSLNGSDGFEQALTRHPDLILLDIRMPGMSGVEMLRRLRAHDEWGAHVPVILVTNMEVEDAEEKAYIEATEPNYYLLKSNTNLNDLVQKIHGLIG